MEKAILLNEIKFMELKLNALKAQEEAEKPKIEALIHRQVSTAFLKGVTT